MPRSSPVLLSFLESQGVVRRQYLHCLRFRQYHRCRHCLQYHRCRYHYRYLRLRCRWRNRGHLHPCQALRLRMQVRLWLAQQLWPVLRLEQARNSWMELELPVATSSASRRALLRRPE